MGRGRTLRSVHIASTLWSTVGVCYILMLVLRQAQCKWWVILLLSGHLAMLVFLLINVYLFVIFKGVKNLREIKAEHLLTRSDCYRALYVTAPVMGGLAGCIATLAANSTVGQSARVAALATVGTTFVIWIVLDPVTTLLETFLSPASRRHRLERLAQAKTSHEVSIREESFG